MTNSADAFRRWLGMFFLTVAFGMMMWGQIVFQPCLHGAGFTIYWAACAAFSLAAIVTALLDIRAVLRTILAERKALIERMNRELKRNQTPDETGRDNREANVRDRNETTV